MTGTQPTAAPQQGLSPVPGGQPSASMVSPSMLAGGAPASVDPQTQAQNAQLEIQSIAALVERLANRYPAAAPIAQEVAAGLAAMHQEILASLTQSLESQGSLGAPPMVP